MKGGEKSCEVYVEHFLKHKEENPIGDKYVFLFDGVLMCYKNSCDETSTSCCKYGNNDKQKIKVMGEPPEVGVCLSNGLKSIPEKSELVEKIETSS